MNAKKEPNALKEEIKAERRALTDGEPEQVSGGSSRFDLQLEKDIKIIDVVNPDTGLVKDNEDLELNKLVDSPSMGTHYQTLI